jgi:hypothetical protein
MDIQRACVKQWGGAEFCGPFSRSIPLPGNVANGGKMRNDERTTRWKQMSSVSCRLSGDSKWEYELRWIKIDKPLTALDSVTMFHQIQWPGKK